MGRIDTPLTAEHFVAWCKKMLGQPYWYGTVVYKCTQDLLDRKSKQYPSHYGSDRTSRYKQDIAAKKVCADCIGGYKGYCWTNGGVGVVESIGTDKTYTSKYGGNGCPDQSANGMFEYAKKKGMAWGTIDSIPEVPGVAVRFDGHVGYYIGNGDVIEWRGFAYGCVKTKLGDRKWTHWYQLTALDYGAADFTGGATEGSYELGDRLLKRGMVGGDVAMLQETLNQAGYDSGEADGIFGAQTEAAVKALQVASALEVDGIYGEKTHAALMSEIDTDGGNTEPDNGDYVEVTKDGRWNVRKGPSTNYGIITTVDKGAKWPYVAEADNGWLAIDMGDDVGWISNTCAELRGDA